MSFIKKLFAKLFSTKPENDCECGSGISRPALICEDCGRIH